MKKVNEIKKILEKKKPILKRKFQVKEIGVFGSLVRGEGTKKSDIDILVEFEDGITLLGFIEMENYLTDLLGIKVDLVMKSALKPRIGEYILKEVVYI
jgi:predicted nucleotidyltransferase